MKVVIFHADGPKAKEFPKDTYKKLILDLKENVNSFGFPLVHLTLIGHEGLGDENFYYNGDSNEVIYNRERFVLEYLSSVIYDDTVYWFTEPDSRLIKEFPPLQGDIALLIRSDTIPITPAWRFCTKKALPFLKEGFACFDLNQKTWGGDAWGYLELYKKMGSPSECGIYNYKGMIIELRRYKDYCHKLGHFSRQYKAKQKFKILPPEFKEEYIKSKTLKDITNGF